MSQACELTGVKPMSGNKVSHSNIKTRTRWNLNLKRKRYLIPELGQTMTLALTARAIRTIDKQGGIVRAIFKGKTEKMSHRLISVRERIRKQSRG